LPHSFKKSAKVVSDFQKRK